MCACGLVEELLRLLSSKTSDVGAEGATEGGSAVIAAETLSHLWCVTV